MGTDGSLKSDGPIPSEQEAVLSIGGAEKASAGPYDFIAFKEKYGAAVCTFLRAEQGDNPADDASISKEADSLLRDFWLDGAHQKAVNRRRLQGALISTCFAGIVSSVTCSDAVWAASTKGKIIHASIALLAGVAMNTVWPRLAELPESSLYVPDRETGQSGSNKGVFKNAETFLRKGFFSRRPAGEGGVHTAAGVEEKYTKYFLAAIRNSPMGNGKSDKVLKDKIHGVIDEVWEAASDDQYGDACNRSCLRTATLGLLACMAYSRFDLSRDMIGNYLFASAAAANVLQVIRPERDYCDSTTKKGKAWRAKVGQQVEEVLGKELWGIVDIEPVRSGFGAGLKKIGLLCGT